MKYALGLFLVVVAALVYFREELTGAGSEPEQPEEDPIGEPIDTPVDPRPVPVSDED